MQFKICAICGTRKRATLKEFIPHKSCRNGIGPYCRPCQKIYRDKWREKNREKIRARRVELYRIRTAPIEAAKHLERVRRQPIRFAAKNLMEGARQRAKERKLPFAKEFRKREFFEQWLERQSNCECCGVNFHFGPKNGVKVDASPSLDQIVSGRGYSLKNTALICWRCNNIKRNYDSNDLRLVAKWIDHKNEVGKFNG